MFTVFYVRCDIVHVFRRILSKEKYRVKWRGYTEEESTWEPIENLQNCMEQIIEFNVKAAQNKRG